MLSRRDALRALAGTAIATRMVSATPSRSRSFGLAYTSFAVRMLQGRDIMRADAARLTSDIFFDLCRRFGTGGGQVDLSQFASRDEGPLEQLRESLERRALFVELSIPARTLEDDEAFAAAASLAKMLGASRLRVALLGGRRYETFETADAWQTFDKRWRDTLSRIKPGVERHGLQLGIENHKDWRASELAEILQRLDSPLIGACVDFGNNVAFLEDPMHVVSTLAPFAITTHLKDMAVRRYEDGFELSEVALGTGILPLSQMVDVLRRAKPELHFCLEMITRDPLKVPYRRDAYWSTFGGRSEALAREFERTVLARESAAPLPRISGLSPEDQIAAEDENVERSEAFARTQLQL
jgi:sugar phosphate isomerase/epimerase